MVGARLVRSLARSTGRSNVARGRLDKGNEAPIRKNKPSIDTCCFLPAT